MKAFIVVSMFAVASVQGKTSNRLETPTCNAGKTICKGKWSEFKGKMMPDVCIPTKNEECWKEWGECPHLDGTRKYLVSANQYQCRVLARILWKVGAQNRLGRANVPVLSKKPPKFPKNWPFGLMGERGGNFGETLPHMPPVATPLYQCVIYQNLLAHSFFIAFT